MRLKESIRAALSGAFEGLPGVRVSVADSRPSDRLYPVYIKTSSKKYRLAAVWAGEGWPSDVKRAMQETKGGSSNPLLLVAKRFSPGSIELLRQHRMNWVDLAGQAQIAVPPALLATREFGSLRSGREAPTNKWSPSALAIAEYLLHWRPRVIRTGDLAQELGWSEGRISQVLAQFDERGWTRRSGGRSGPSAWRTLSQLDSLLDAWSAYISSHPPTKQLGHRSSRDLLRFAHMELPAALGYDMTTWALTGWAALELVAPFTTIVPTLQVYVDPALFGSDLHAVMESAGIRPVDEGGRIEFWCAPPKLITQTGKPSEIPVASTPRVYADLIGLGGRGQDAAVHLRQVELGL